MQGRTSTGKGEKKWRDRRVQDRPAIVAARPGRCPVRTHAPGSPHFSQDRRGCTRMPSIDPSSAPNPPSSLPAASALTLLAGALFGLGLGASLVSIASTLGATLAFLSSRYLFRDLVQQRFGDRLKAVNDGVRREGGYYLFTLRLVPVIPFF